MLRARAVAFDRIIARRLAAGNRFLDLCTAGDFAVIIVGQVASLAMQRKAGEPPALRERLMAVLLIGTLDTKGNEVAFVRDRLVAANVPVLVLDAGVLGPPAFP